MKKVEILLATFNGEPYLSEQLDSILSQDTQNWHLTASDDGSSDRTVEILDAYAQTYPEKITRVVSGRQFHNARDHFFWLMEQCDADYIQFCDQDDVWHPDKLRLLQEALEEAEAAYGTDTPLLAFSDQAVVDKDLGLIAPSLMTLQQQNPKVLDYRNLLYQNVVSGCTMAVNRPLAKLAAGCTDTQQVIMHDWWLALTAARFGKMVYVDRATIDYRQHGNNSVGAKDVRSPAFLIYKLLHLREFRKTVFPRKQQALCFLESFRDRLAEEERAYLRDFGADRSSVSLKREYSKRIQSPVRKIGFWVRW